MTGYRDPEPSLVPPYSPGEARRERAWENYCQRKDPLEEKLTTLEHELEDVTLCLEALTLLDPTVRERCMEVIQEDYTIKIEAAKCPLLALEELLED